jgi:hypothetical protein
LVNDTRHALLFNYANNIHGKLENTTVIPMFSLIEGGLFVVQANNIINQYALRRRWDTREEHPILGTTLGALDNRQVTFLLGAAVSRLIDNILHTPSHQDYWIRGTILALYRNFTKTFLQEYPYQRGQHTLFLNAFLDRVGELNGGHSTAEQRVRLPHFRWEMMIEGGEWSLNKLFPFAAKYGPIELPFPDGYESVPGWLEEMGAKLEFAVATTSRS